MKLSRPTFRTGCCATIIFFLMTTGTVLSQECVDLDLDGYVAGEGCAVQDDCNDQNPSTHPGAVELCNGWDDDCDGELDESCDRVCEDFGVERERLIKSWASFIKLTVAERGWGITYEDPEGETPPLSVFRRLSETGTPISPGQKVDGSESTHGLGGSVELLWNGTGAVAGWTVNNHFTRYRPLGPWGKSQTPDIGLHLEDRFTGLQSMLWTGSQYSILWADRSTIPSPEGILLSRFIVGGSVLEDGSYLSYELMESDLAWNNGRYSWIYRLTDYEAPTSDLYCRPLNEFGDPIAQEIRLTSHTQADTFATSPTIIAGNGTGFALAWEDDRTGADEIWFAQLDADCNMLPTGEIQVTQSGGLGSVDPFVLWTGEEYFLTWTKLGACGGGGEIHGARVSSSGSVIQSRILTPGPCDTFARTAWNGSNIGMVFGSCDEFPNCATEVEFALIGCDCDVDADQDGSLTCQGDCDDTDPDANPAERETCTDGKDNDCDDLIDCDDPDCSQGGQPPGTIANISWAADKITLIWDEDSRSNRYDLIRGNLDELAGMENFIWANCLAAGVPDTQSLDADIPENGKGYYYLVRGHARTCLVGSWGNANRDDTVSNCQ